MSFKPEAKMKEAFSTHHKYLQIGYRAYIYRECFRLTFPIKWGRRIETGLGTPGVEVGVGKQSWIWHI